MSKPTLFILVVVCTIVFCSVASSACPYMAGKQRRPLPDEQPSRRQLIFENIDIFQWFLSFLTSFFGGGDGGGGGGGTAESVSEALQLATNDIQAILNNNLQAEIVRLAFHDCVGGCDGCVDLDNPENFGLRRPIEELEPIFSTYQEYLTRADIWVLAAFVANERAQDPDDDLVSFPMQFYGRPSCNDPTGGPSRSLPSAHLTSSQVVSFFETTFGFTAQETVAIMGAHTL